MFPIEHTKPTTKVVYSETCWLPSTVTHPSGTTPLGPCAWGRTEPSSAVAVRGDSDRLTPGNDAPFPGHSSWLGENPEAKGEQWDVRRHLLRSSGKGTVPLLSTEAIRSDPVSSYEVHNVRTEVWNCWGPFAVTWGATAGESGGRRRIPYRPRMKPALSEAEGRIRMNHGPGYVAWVIT